MAAVFGDWEESYAFLPKLILALEVSNPGTIFSPRYQDEEIQSPVAGNNRQFKRLFWAFKPCIDGFPYCVPVIQVDGTFLTGKYKGTLLIASGADANRLVYPLAFAIVEGENTDSYGWFFRQIQLHVTRRTNLTIISDRHAGIRAAILGLDPAWNWSQRWCIRHFKSNWNHHFKRRKLADSLWWIAVAYQEKKFKEKMQNIRQICPEGAQWLDQHDLEMWTFHKDGGHRWGIATTNSSESINNVYRECRALPISAIVEMTFWKTNRWFVNRLHWCEKR
ncbi:unnamed protein product, partial [Linum tenue]